MNHEWRAVCRGAGFWQIAEDWVEVRFEKGRSQRGGVGEHSASFFLRSVVARAPAVNELPEAALKAWHRNRSISLAGFRVDERGRMLGEIWIPKCGLDASEFRFLMRHLAEESDRFEFQLTGSDQE